MSRHINWRRIGGAVAAIAGVAGGAMILQRVTSLRPLRGYVTGNTPPASSGRVWPMATPFYVSSVFLPARKGPVDGVVRPHQGMDIAAPTGTPVYAVGPGKALVYPEPQQGSFGNLVIVEEAGGVRHYYAHLSRFAVSSGDTVRAGQLIGYVGSTGRSTGPHLHYEFRQWLAGKWVPVDPAKALGPLPHGARLNPKYRWS